MGVSDAEQPRIINPPPRVNTVPRVRATGNQLHPTQNQHQAVPSVYFGNTHMGPATHAVTMAGGRPVYLQHSTTPRSAGSVQTSPIESPSYTSFSPIQGAAVLSGPSVHQNPHFQYPMLPTFVHPQISSAASTASIPASSPSIPPLSPSSPMPSNLGHLGQSSGQNWPFFVTANTGQAAATGRRAPPHPNFTPQAVSRQPQGHLPLLPRAGEVVISSQNPDPLRVALHQAHLRSPPRKIVREYPGTEEPMELFQHIQSFAVDPTLLEPGKSSFRWQFSVTSDDFKRFPRHVQKSVHENSVKVLCNGSRMYRLRCVRLLSTSEPVNENTWCLAECAWPSVVYLHVNKVEMFPRRKVYYGKDLPLDITGLLKEGMNEVSIHTIRGMAESKDLSYTIAVEVMDIANFNSIRELVTTLPAAASREHIQKRLSSHAGDEELAIVNDSITIDLIDPFTARVCDVPARGIDCTHHECFDLDVFLKTRQLQVGGSGKPAASWKCPICRCDARPKTLLIDGFLAEVREELERTKRLAHTKAIHVKADGSWEPLPDKESRRSSIGASTTGEPTSLKRSRSVVEAEPLKEDSDGPPLQRPQVREIIELD